MKNNKGFSLVELIIVIAIVAILVAMVAANVVRYVEKANVSADLRYLDGISAAVTYALMDPDVLEDPSSAQPLHLLEQATQGRQGISLSDLASPAGNRVAVEIAKTMGWSSLSVSDYMAEVKSTHSGGSDIYVQHKGGAITPYAVWITYTDSTGGRDISQGPTDWDNVGKCICAD